MDIIHVDYEYAKDFVLRRLLDGYREKIYVEAWEGVGATALLREVAEAVETSEEGKREFETVIKVGQPALFRNRREMQRAVAEQLNLLLPSPSMTAAAFNAADEDDDFSLWTVFGSRDQLPEVRKQIYRAVEGRSVLLVFCNSIADGKLIDPIDLGIPIITGLISNAVVWTTRMNIRREATSALISNAVVLTTRMNISRGATSASADWIVRIKPTKRTTALDLVYKEAVEIARYIDESSGGLLRTTGQAVLRCFWYYCLLLSSRTFSAFSRSALLLPDGGGPLEAAVKYFVCDGILQGDDDAASWEIGKALAPVIGSIVNDQQLQYWLKELTSSTWTPREKEEKKELLPPMTLLVDSITLQGDWVKSSSPSSLSSEEEEEESSYRWISVCSPHNNILEPWDFFFKVCRSSVTSGVSSIFFEHFEDTHELALPDGFFVDHFSNVRVLDLLGCVVSPIIGYSSFLRLRNLRMLRLERCKVTTSLDPNSHSAAPEGRREPILFDNLWVLNLYDTDADAFLLAGKAFELMPNLRELDITDCEGLEYLNFNLPATIETISLQRCASLKEVELVDPAAVAPLPNLKTFRLSGSKLIAKLSLRGCRKLENVDLQELTGLEVLDLSCTAIKVLDISKLPQLKQLFLLGCGQLCGVAGLHKGPKLNVLYLDNYRSGGACDIDRCLDSFRHQRPSDQLTAKGANDADQRLFHAHVVVRDRC